MNQGAAAAEVRRLRRPAEGVGQRPRRRGDEDGIKALVPLIHVYLAAQVASSCYSIRTRAPTERFPGFARRESSPYTSVPHPHGRPTPIGPSRRLPPINDVPGGAGCFSLSSGSGSRARLTD